LALWVSYVLKGARERVRRKKEQAGKP
jgi:hypothetical protein